MVCLNQASNVALLVSKRACLFKMCAASTSTAELGEPVDDFDMYCYERLCFTPFPVGEHQACSSWSAPCRRRLRRFVMSA